ncbi:MAG: hypothetical protein WC558_13000 [Patulibacter sp.]
MAASNKKRRSRSSRKRRAAGAPPRPPRPEVTEQRPVVPAGIPSLKARREEAPKPLWHPWPITELLILVGIVVAVIGLIGGSIPTTIGGLVILGSASTELAYREHFAGYRSHSAMLASAVAVIGITAVAFLGSRIGVNVPPWLLAVAGIATFGGLFVSLRRGFRRRTGLSFRV